MYVHVEYHNNNTIDSYVIIINISKTAIATRYVHYIYISRAGQISGWEGGDHSQAGKRGLYSMVSDNDSQRDQSPTYFHDGRPPTPQPSSHWTFQITSLLPSIPPFTLHPFPR